MKKFILGVIAVIVSVNLGLPQMPVLAKESEEKMIDIDGSEKSEPITTEELQEPDSLPEVTEINHLLIPQKLQVVIDPWEMDGKGQVYSEQYTIKNVGDTQGILTLSNLACEMGEESGVSVKDSVEGLHGDENKSVYMEIIFEDKDKIVLSQKGTAYEVELEPEEELHISFSGEVNENAVKSWKDGDLGVTVTYSWEAIGISGAEELKETEDLGDASESDGKTEESEPEVIELKEENRFELSVDSWEINEDETISSVQYCIRNAGELTGTFTLSDVICKPTEQSGIEIQADKENLHEGGDKAVYMEFVPEQKEREDEKFVLLSDVYSEEQEASAYEVELKPGEELIFRFTGELNGMKPEDLEVGDVAVTANCSWMLTKDDVE